MNQAVPATALLEIIASFDPPAHRRERALALLSAAVASGNEPVMDRAFDGLDRFRLTAADAYEIVLQSYLFLGFPRMLTAAECLAARHSHYVEPAEPRPVSGREGEEWFSRGTALCRRVYDSSYDLLKERVCSIAPEVFRWMIVEGYGKVLSRPGLTPVERELAVVACLIWEDREKQLFSHMRGTLNVGGSSDLLRAIIADLFPAVPAGCRTAREIMARLEQT
jgi:alkylhydroperoxidase/carboxymuconolactone decarboxylase family protein YurZ